MNREEIIARAKRLVETVDAATRPITPEQRGAFLEAHDAFRAFPADELARLLLELLEERDHTNKAIAMTLDYVSKTLGSANEKGPTP